MKLESYGKYGLHTNLCPSGKWGYVGTVPEILLQGRKNKLGLTYHISLLFDTEEQAINHFNSVKHLIN